jgi:hypothetical protein
VNYIKDATIFGDQLHLVVEGDIAMGRIAGDLGVPPGGIEAIEPSLEDVFVALTRQRHAA